MVPQVSTLLFFNDALLHSWFPPAPSALERKKGNVSEEVSSSQKKTLLAEVTHYSLCPTHKKTFCSPTACCHLGFWSLLQLWTAYPCLRAPQWFSINGLHLGHMSKWLAITSRQTGDTTREARPLLLDLCIVPPVRIRLRDCVRYKFKWTAHNKLTFVLFCHLKSNKRTKMWRIMLIPALNYRKANSRFCKWTCCYPNTFVRGWQRQLTSVRLFIRENKPQILST